jgi:hypothetical protein
MLSKFNYSFYCSCNDSYYFSDFNGTCLSSLIVLITKNAPIDVRLVLSQLADAQVVSLKHHW